MERWQLDDEVLKRYIFDYLGHGSYKAKYWFVGMEFGGGNTIEEVESRIQGWYDRGAHELEDVTGPDNPGSKWFRGSIPLQPTWSKVIRVILSAEGQTPDKEDLRAYQRDYIGRVGGLDCILEMFSLPSPSLAHWQFYAEHSNLPFLRSRKEYSEEVAPARVAHIRKRIEEHKPLAVVFYGSGYEHWWREIAGVDLTPSTVANVKTGQDDHTLYVSMRHPISHGLKNSYFDDIGRLIAAFAPGYGKIGL